MTGLSKPETSASPRLSKAQRELLAEFHGSRHPDRHVNARYRRTAEALVRAGLLRRCIGTGWYEITREGREHG